jgi:hypothetical protein
LKGQLLLCQLSITEPTPSGIERLVSATGALELTAVPLAGGAASHHRLMVPGTGFDAESARRMVVERLAEAAAKDQWVARLHGF